MNPSKLPPLESIREKIRQGESLSITEKLQLIWENKLALVVSLIFGLVVPGLVLNFKLKAEHCQTDAGKFLGLVAPMGVWIALTLLLGLVSLNSVFSTYGLLGPQDKRSNVIRGIICLSIEIAWLAIDPVWLTGVAADWYELILVAFLLLLIVFSNLISFGGWITEGQARRNNLVWENSHEARHQQSEVIIAGLRLELEKAQANTDRLRDFFSRVQQMADACPAGSSGTSVLDIKRRKEPSGACRHEILLREADVKRTRCRELAPIVLSDPLLDCPTTIGCGRSSTGNNVVRGIANATTGKSGPVPDAQDEVGGGGNLKSGESAALSASSSGKSSESPK